MTTYLISRVNVRDLTGYMSGPRPILLDLLDRHGGSVIAATNSARMITGGQMEGNRTVICKFQDDVGLEKWLEEAARVQQAHQDVFDFIRLVAVPESDSAPNEAEPTAEVPPPAAEPIAEVSAVAAETTAAEAAQ